MEQTLNDIATSAITLFRSKIITLPYYNGIHYSNNVKSLQIKMADQTLAVPIYSVFSNTILFPPKKINAKLLLHELIHMASANRTTINKMSYRMGYQIVTDNAKRITALNEGLTQLIVCNVTDGNDLQNDVYPFETRIAKMLCYIFGEAEIYNHFFKADPESFIRNIMTKTNDNSILTLILKMDELLSTMKSDETKYFDEKCGLILFDIQKILVDMYLKMKDMNKLEYKEMASMFMTKDCDNYSISSSLLEIDMDIDQYLRDRIRQK